MNKQTERIPEFFRVVVNGFDLWEPKDAKKGDKFILLTLRVSHEAVEEVCDSRYDSFRRAFDFSLSVEYRFVDRALKRKIETQNVHALEAVWPITRDSQSVTITDHRFVGRFDFRFFLRFTDENKARVKGLSERVQECRAIHDLLNAKTVRLLFSRANGRGERRLEGLHQALKAV